MWYENCKRIVEAAIHAGIVCQVRSATFLADSGTDLIPMSPNDIVVWREAGHPASTYPEGWYNISLDEAAQSLVRDTKGRSVLMGRLQELEAMPELIE